METYRIDKRAQIEEDSIKCDDAHGLQRIAVHNVTANDSVADLDASSNYDLVS